jgi:uncharacterized protein (DUF302 family)
MSKRRGGLLACAVVLFGAALGGILVFSRCGKQPRGEDQMSDTAFTVNHIRVTTDRPFEDVTAAFESRLGRFDPDVSKGLAASADAETIRTKLEGMVGPSEFMLFGTSDHGALLRLAGQKRKAVQYVVGNPLFAVQMTRHDIRAGLYAPLRVLVYENEQGKTCLEYDRPSSLFGQFENAEVTAVAVMLDRKLEKLVGEAIR